MTAKALINILRNVPLDAKIMSNSGWEVDETDVEKVWYSPSINEVHFTQDESSYYIWRNTERICDFICLNESEKKGEI